MTIELCRFVVYLQVVTNVYTRKQEVNSRPCGSFLQTANLKRKDAVSSYWKKVELQGVAKTDCKEGVVLAD